MSERTKEFKAFRERMNERLLESGNLDLRRFFALDDRIYLDGALKKETKELLGLVASMVLRCDDCVSYHLIECKESGFTDEQVMEAMTVALVVGGSITIPHIRRAADFLDELSEESGSAD